MPKKKPKLKLEVGKRFRDGNGDEVAIIDYFWFEEFPFAGSNGRSYARNGRHEQEYITGSDWDLIEEIK